VYAIFATLESFVIPNGLAVRNLLFSRQAEKQVPRRSLRAARARNDKLGGANS
jgi:hypothetical protein